jgi:hypothetical protein
MITSAWPIASLASGDRPGQPSAPMPATVTIWEDTGYSLPYRTYEPSLF